MRKGDTPIPAENRAITLLDAHRTYTAVMSRQDRMVMEAIAHTSNEQAIIRSLDEAAAMRGEIGRGIENMAHASTLLRSLASTWDVTPWVTRLLKEIDQTTKRIA